MDTPTCDVRRARLSKRLATANHTQHLLACHGTFNNSRLSYIHGFVEQGRGSSFPLQVNSSVCTVREPSRRPMDYAGGVRERPPGPPPWTPHRVQMEALVLARVPGPGPAPQRTRGWRGSREGSGVRSQRVFSPERSQHPGYLLHLEIAHSRSVMVVGTVQVERAATEHNSPTY